MMQWPCPARGQAAISSSNFQIAGSASGRVSGITSQASSIPAAATPAMLQNVMTLPK
jgi:hypothetical protein